MQLIDLQENADDPLLGAGCTLEEAQMPARLREWAGLRDRSTAINEVPGGVVLVLTTEEPIDLVAGLAARESECCPFYTFALRVEGQARELEITAGAGREIAVRALLGLI
ncbi:MAG: hypothetical protein E6J47_05245 [Chloroflexi bacterium]|nr:MAG: hypothetical protein E6J47_05245 [Chloroflexota bacterium]